MIVRPEFVYGRGDRHVVGLFRAIQQGRFFYIGSGETVCHPTYVDDVVAGLLACATERARPGQSYHICGPRPVSFCEFAGAIAAALGVGAPRLRFPVWLVRAGAWGAELAGRILRIDPPITLETVRFFGESRAFSIDKARRELEWSPKVEIVEGARRSVAWYREQEML